MSHPYTQDLPPGFTPPTNTRFRRGRGRSYIPDVVERVRVLVEGTGLSQAAIAARTGISDTTIFNWTRRHGWVRPSAAERWKPLVAADRAGFGPPLRAAFGRIEVLAGREVARLEAEAERIEAEARLARRLAERARRAAQLMGPDAVGRGEARVRVVGGGEGLLRLSGVPLVRVRAARSDDTVAKARVLVETSLMSQAEIARRVGISRVTLSRWTQDGAWLRPADAPAQLGGQKVTRRWRERDEARREARRRIEEAEGLLCGMDGEERVGPARLAEAVARLDGALAALRPGGCEAPGGRGDRRIGVAGSGPAMTP